MISDCAVYAPEKYPFRIGMIISACLIFCNAVLFYFYIGYKSARSAWDKVGVVLAGLASSGLAVVGAVNEQEDNAVHSTAAVIFFFAYEFFMVLGASRLSRIPSTLPRSLFIKRAIAAVTSVLLTGFVYFSQHWGKYHIQIAICEWLGVIFILLYNLSMVYEFSGEYAAEMIMGSSSPSLPTTAAHKPTPAPAPAPTRSPLPAHYTPAYPPAQPPMPFFANPYSGAQYPYYIPMQMVANN